VALCRASTSLVAAEQERRGWPGRSPAMTNQWPLVLFHFTSISTAGRPMFRYWNRKGDGSENIPQ
jgi:hypothetical protein